MAERAKPSQGFAFLSLNHYLDLYWLEAAYGRTRKDGAVGVDGQTAADDAADDDSESSSERKSPPKRSSISLSRAVVVSAQLGEVNLRCAATVSARLG
jgi:hypothetical protein